MRSAVVRSICGESARLAFERRIAAAGLEALAGETPLARLHHAAHVLQCFPGELLIRLAGHPDLRAQVIYGTASGLGNSANQPQGGGSQRRGTGGGQSSEIAA